MKQETKELITKRAEIKQRELKPEDFTHIEALYINRLLITAFIVGCILGLLVGLFLYVII